MFHLMVGIIKCLLIFSCFNDVYISQSFFFFFPNFNVITTFMRFGYDTKRQQLECVLPEKSIDVLKISSDPKFSEILDGPFWICVSNEKYNDRSKGLQEKEKGVIFYLFIYFFYTKYYHILQGIKIYNKTRSAMADGSRAHALKLIISRCYILGINGI